MATSPLLVVVDVSALGGITAAIAEGEAIIAIGTMAPAEQELHAVRLEAPKQPAATKPTAR